MLVHTHRESKRRRAARWLGSIAGGVVALSVLATVGGWFGLQTAAGGRLIKRVAMERVNQSIAGHLEIGVVEFRGRWVTLRDVMLSDADHVPVARWARLTI